MKRYEEVSRYGPELRLATALIVRESLQVLADAHARQWSLPDPQKGRSEDGKPPESPAEKRGEDDRGGDAPGR